MPEVPLYPVEAFFTDPVRSAATNSPDGTRLAYLAEHLGHLNVWVEDLETGEAHPVTHDARRSIKGYRWTADPRWLLYSQDEGGDEAWHVFRVDLRQPEQPAVDLTPFPGVVVHYELLRGEPCAALVTMNLRRPDEVDVHRVDVATGEITPVAENPGWVAGWVLGASGDVYARRLEEGGDETLLRWVPGGELVELVTFAGAHNPLSLVPLQVTPDGSGLWVGSNRHSEHTQLWYVDGSDGSETLLAARDGVSVDETGGVVPSLPAPLITDRATGELLAVRFLGERQELVVLDERFPRC